MINGKKYKKNYPYNNVEKITSVRELMDKAVAAAGDQPAFKYKENKEIKTVTYREFQNDIFCLGTGLSNLGVISSHVACIGENSYKWLVVYLTMLQTNGVFVPIDKELPLQDIINVLADSDSEVLFYSAKYEKWIPEIMAALPRMKYFVAFGEEKAAEGEASLAGASFADAETAGASGDADVSAKRRSFREIMEKGKTLYQGGDTSYTSIKTELTTMRMLVYTSGTTGMAKGVMLSEKNLVAVAYDGLRTSTVYTRCLSVLPYHHTYEGVAGILVSLHKHACICINESLKAVLKNMQLYKPDYIYLVPAFVEIFYKRIWSNAHESGKDKTLARMMKLSNFLRKFHIDLRGVFFKSIHEAFGGNLIKIVSGGAPIRPELGEFFDAIGINLINGYGITECSPLVSANRDYFNDCATVGVKIPCIDIKFEDIDGEGNGEICVKGDIVMLGYYKNPELTAEVLSPDGWFKTGDYGHMNDKGQLVITGRKKNIIVLDNGKNIFPEELENYIMNIPYIGEVVVRGIKGKDGGETGLMAEVYLSEEKLAEATLADGRKLCALSMEELKKQVSKDISRECEKLPVYKQITRVCLRDKAFDKTTTNKIKR